MTSLPIRIIRVVHSSPGRTRLRLPWLRASREAATDLADHLAGLDGMVEVSVSARSGSVLCHYDPAQLTEARIVTAVRRHTNVAIVRRPGDPEHPTPIAEVSALRGTGSRLGQALTEAVKGIDADVRGATDGLLDLGALAGFGFLTAGAVEVVTSRKLPAPPWFNLAWWAFRTFTMFESPPDEQGPAPLVDRAASSPRSGVRRIAPRREAQRRVRGRRT